MRTTRIDNVHQIISLRCKSLSEMLARSKLAWFSRDYRWMDYPARNYNVRHPNDCSVQTFRGHYVATTLIRAYFSPLHTTGQRYVYSASADGCVYIYGMLGHLIEVSEYDMV